MSLLQILRDSARHKKHVREHIEDEMRPTLQYVLLLVLSTLIAHLGIIAGQATVTIGSMILSPMMWPIVGIGAGIVANRPRMILSGIATLLGSVGFAVFVSFCLTLLFNEQAIVLNTEITSRITPTLLDLLIALAIGIAGVLVLSWEKVSDAAAGIAIASSLLPPLTVTGIGLALGNMDIASGSFLLFLTNAAAIIFTGILMFLLLGHHRSDDHKGNGLLTLSLLTSIIGLAVLAVPLTISLTQIFTDVTHSRQAQMELETYFGELDNTVNLDSVQVHTAATGSGNILQVAAVVRAGENFRLDYGEAATLQSRLESRLGQAVSLDLRTLPQLGSLSESAQMRETRTRQSEAIAALLGNYLEKKDPRIKIDTLKISSATPVTISLLVLAPMGVEITNDDRLQLLQILHKQAGDNLRLDISVLRTSTITEKVVAPDTRVLQTLEATVDDFATRTAAAWNVTIAAREASVKNDMYSLRITLRVADTAGNIDPLISSLKNTLRSTFRGLEKKLSIEVTTQYYQAL